MKKYTLYLALSLLTLTGCEYLDIKPTQWQGVEDVFSSPDNYFKSCNYAYSYILPGLNRIGSSFLEAATDDGMSTITTSNIHKVADGYITAASPIVNCWNNSYQGIRQALFAQTHMAEYDVIINGQTPEQAEATKQKYIHEMYALRAWFELDLLKHYGGFPIVDKVYDVGDDEVETKGRDSFEDCVKHIVTLCDQAASGLDVTTIGGNGGRGRMNKGIALAIKARTLVYAASPLYNQVGNSNELLGYTDGNAGLEQRWKDAAKACADVINLCNDGTINPSGTKRYSLRSAAYDKIFIGNLNQNNSEYIMVATRQQDNNFENRHFPPSLSKNQSSGGGTVPTQELVDAFTMADGSDFVRTDWNNQNPQYENRDPRLKAIIGYDGCAYNKRTIYTRVNSANSGIDALNEVIDRSTTTGYYLAKFCDKTIDFTKAKPATTFHAMPHIRLADIYLLYAEAMAHAYGIDDDPEGYGMTAREAVQAIRTRAGFGADDKFLEGVSDVDTFIKKVKQERRVELCFEEQRYFDLRRWMDGDVLNQPVHGIRIEEAGDGSLNYSYFEADSRRKFEDKMYYHPIPLGVIRQAGGVIVQNPGW